MKTNKSFTKRIRVTKKGKLVARKSGQNHYNAKESAGTKNVKRRNASVRLSNKAKARFLPRSGA
ncbi:MAG: 50S ribosomal protein L35 [Candidatus Paceibacteria bacterium]